MLNCERKKKEKKNIYISQRKTYFGLVTQNHKLSWEKFYVPNISPEFLLEMPLGLYQVRSIMTF